MRHTPHAPELRAQVLAEIALGYTDRAIARRHKIPVQTVHSWRRESQPAAVVDEKTQVDLGRLISDYIEVGLHALKAQAEHSRNREWLDKQNAHDLAIFHGVLTDKIIKILQALGEAPDVPVSPDYDLPALDTPSPERTATLGG